MASYRTMDFEQGPGGADSPGSGLPPGVALPPPYVAPPRPPTTDNPYWPNEPPAGAPPSSGNTPGSPPPTPPPATAPPAAPPATAPAAASGSLDPATVIGEWMTSNNPQKHQDANYWIGRINATGGLNAGNLEYWRGRFLEAPGTHQEGGTPGLNYQGTSVFSDPATQAWEKLVNQMVDKLGQNYQPAGYQPMIDYLNKYFTQLQGPAYTPSQMDLIQTQSTDPLMQSRDNARQQILQNFASRGLTPDSPIVQSALEQSDQKYGVANTQSQAGFATNAIGLENQNRATAAQVAQQIPQAQQGLYNYNLGNQQQGVNLANQIPTTAWNRLTGASSLIQPLNPGALVNSQMYGQQVGYGQSNDFMSQLIDLLVRNHIFG